MKAKAFGLSRYFFSSVNRLNSRSVAANWPRICASIRTIRCQSSNGIVIKFTAWPQVHCAAAADCWFAEFGKDSANNFSVLWAPSYGINFHTLLKRRQATKSRLVALRDKAVNRSTQAIAYHDGQHD